MIICFINNVLFMNTRISAVLFNMTFNNTTYLSYFGIILILVVLGPGCTFNLQVGLRLLIHKLQMNDGCRKQICRNKN